MMIGVIPKEIQKGKIIAGTIGIDTPGRGSYS